MARYKQLRQRPQFAAVLVAHGVPAPPGRVRFASYGAGVALAGVVPVGVEVVTEAQARLRTGKRAISLTRFAPGVRIPGHYRLIAELGVQD